MRPIPPKRKTGPEAEIQDAIEKYLRGREWIVRATHGNAYQSGFPDLYAAHRRFGQRWIEVKNPLKYEFTEAQLEFFPLLASVNIGVWILVAATEEEYQKLWLPPNYHHYLPANKVVTRTFKKESNYVAPKTIRKLIN